MALLSCLIIVSVARISVQHGNSFNVSYCQSYISRCPQEGPSCQLQRLAKTLLGIPIGRSAISYVKHCVLWLVEQYAGTLSCVFSCLILLVTFSHLRGASFETVHRHTAVDFHHSYDLCCFHDIFDPCRRLWQGPCTSSAGSLVDRKKAPIADNVVTCRSGV